MQDKNKIQRILTGYFTCSGTCPQGRGHSGLELPAAVQMT